MKAAIYRETGPSSVLSVEEVPTPEPGPGHVRVRMVLSGVNPTDWKSRSGATAGAPAGFQVPHHDGAGIVDATGDGVPPSRVGERVWLYLAAAGNPWGTAAQYCVVPAERAVPLPSHASFELGACLGVPAVTAAHCLAVRPGGGGPSAGGEPPDLTGSTVLVAGGAGAVGHYAIELAKYAGARVATTVSTPEKARLARAAGADLVVDYRQPGAAAELKAFSPGYSRVVEVALGANLDLDLAVAGPGTVIVVYASERQDPVIPVRRLMTANATLHWALLYTTPKWELDAAVSWTGAALADGALSALPLHLFSLEGAAAAQDAVEKGAVGKVLVRLPEA